MRGTWLPIQDFLRIILQAVRLNQKTTELRSGLRQWRQEGASAFGKIVVYDGIVVIFDRKADRRSNLLEKVIQDLYSLDDVTGNDILIVIPSPESRPGGVDEWVLDPNKDWEDGVGAPGLYVANKNPDWSTILWYYANEKVEEYATEVRQDQLRNVITKSVGDVRDYLNLSEKDDVPSLVLLCLKERKLFVFRYAQTDDVYSFFKQVVDGRPDDRSGPWLANCVTNVANDLCLQSETPLHLFAPEELKGWQICKYDPAGFKPLKMRKAQY
jgi:hypothetical protein